MTASPVPAEYLSLHFHNIALWFLLKSPIGFNLVQSWVWVLSTSVDPWKYFETKLFQPEVNRTCVSSHDCAFLHYETNARIPWFWYSRCTRKTFFFPYTRILDFYISELQRIDPIPIVSPCSTTRWWDTWVVLDFIVGLHEKKMLCSQRVWKKCEEDKEEESHHLTKTEVRWHFIWNVNFCH